MREVQERGSGPILVVDDEVEVRGYLSAVLDDAGFPVRAAESGRQARQMLRAQEFELVLMDLVMADGEGIETIQLLRREHPDLKIIAISGAFGGSLLRAARSLGASLTLSKPISPDELIEAVTSLLG